MHTLGISHGFENREEFIRYFFNIASAIQKTQRLSQRQQPLFISLDGDSMSGKGLVALAMDMAFNPERYPDEIIDRNDKVDDILSSENARTVHFRNLRNYDPIQDRDAYDECLKQNFWKVAPQSRVHFISNLEYADDRILYGDDAYFDSDLLDMTITVRKDDDYNILREAGLDAFILSQMINSFNRTVDIRVRQRTPLSKIIQSVSP